MFDNFDNVTEMSMMSPEEFTWRTRQIQREMAAQNDATAPETPAKQATKNRLFARLLRSFSALRLF